MKHPTVYGSALCLAALLAFPNHGSARPIEFSEISLLVRAHQSEASIKQEVSERRLMRALTPQEETKLKSQGASESLIQSLHNSSLVISKEEAAAFESARQEHARRIGESTEAGAHRDAQGKLYVFDVALGHPINLSQWGGIDYELAFYSYRCAGEDIVEPAIIDPVRTVSVVSRNIPTGGLSEDELFAQDNGRSRDWYRRQRFVDTDSNGHRFTPYDSRNDLRDDRFNFSDTVSASSYSASRPLAIDFSSPVTIEGVPYALYPVYGAGGVSIYYISGSSSSVRLAVSTTH